MKKLLKVICALVAFVMILNTQMQFYATEQPTEKEKNEQISINTSNIDKRIYGIKLSQNRAYLLPGSKLQLTVRGITDPDELHETISSHNSYEEIPYSDITNDTTELTDQIQPEAEQPTVNSETEEHISTSVENCLPFAWNSCNEEFAVVDQNGTVTAISPGMAVIMVTTADQAFMDVCEVMVVDELPEENSEEANEILSIWEPNHYGIAINWVNQYESTTSTTSVKTITPGTLLEIISKSGNFYYAKVASNGKPYYMWADGIYDRTANGIVDIALKSNTSDRRKHRDVYLSNKIELCTVPSVNSNTWKSTNSNIATVSSAGVVTPKAEGNVCITASQGGVVRDAIHITVIKKYSPAKYGIVNANGCGEYRCANVNCTMQGRKVADWASNSELIIYGISGGFYYGKITTSNNYTYFWKDNVNVQTWFPKCELLKESSERNYFPQGFAMDSNYCYAFEIAVNNNNEEVAHKLYRYNIHTGEKKLMTPTNTIGNLYHANDAALVTFDDNGVKKQYIFVAAWSPKATNYIVKLRIDSNGNYSESARYNLGKIQVVGISLLSGGGSSPAVFLLKSGNEFYTATIPYNKKDETPVWDFSPSYKFKLDSDAKPNNTAQGIHYDQSKDKLYIAVSGTGGNHVKNKVLMFSNIRNRTGNITSVPTSWNIDKYSAGQINATTFELEGVAFNPNQSDKRLWFSALDINSSHYVKGVICADTQNIR